MSNFLIKSRRVSCSFDKNNSSTLSAKSLRGFMNFIVEAKLYPCLFVIWGTIAFITDVETPDMRPKWGLLSTEFPSCTRCSRLPIRDRSWDHTYCTSFGWTFSTIFHNEVHKSSHGIIFFHCTCLEQALQLRLHRYEPDFFHRRRWIWQFNYQTRNFATLGRFSYVI